LNLEPLVEPKAEDEEAGLQNRFATVHAQLTDALRRAIFRGEFPPGGRLRQVELAERFGVSPVPVREALRALEQEGVVASIPRRGWIVTKLSVEDIQEIYELREFLEQRALRDAMPNLTEDILVELRRLTEVIRSSTSPQDHLESRDRFYAVLYGASSKKRLVALILNLHNQLAPYLRLLRSAQSGAAHDKLMQALEARDRKGASRMISEHLAQISNECVATARMLEGGSAES
jgi:DNA-binding GntR family transcriptional regulator